MIFITQQQKRHSFQKDGFTYTSRKIHGRLRRVKIKKKSNGKEQVLMRHPYKRGVKPKAKFLTSQEARKINATRSKRSQALDEKKSAKLTYSTNWEKNPGKYDYPGVDTKKKRIKGSPKKKQKRTKQTEIKN